MVNFIDEEGVFVKNIQNDNTYDPVATKMCPDGQYWSGLYSTGCLDDPNYSPKIAAPIEMHLYDPIDASWLKRMTDISLQRPDALAPTPIVVSSVVETTPPKVETILGNGLTNSQKWAWVIGLTFGAWALLYWSQKKSN